MSDELIADSVARLFAEQVDHGHRERAEAGAFDAALWRRVADAGFTAMLASEAGGGLGQEWSAAYPVLRGLGAWAVPLPLAETMVAAQLLTLGGMALPDGPLTLIEQGRGNTITAQDSPSGLRLSGVAHAVPWARHARGVVVSLAGGGAGAPGRPGQIGRLAWLDLAEALADGGATLQPQANVAGLPADTLQLHEARCGAVAPNPLALAEPVWTLGALAHCAMIVGALESVLAQSLRYAGERVQFGRTIGSNQVIQHQLALMAGDVAAARMATLVAMADASGGDDALHRNQHGLAALFSTAVAKVRCGEAATRAAAIAHQVHGAIGFTQEHALHFTTRRLWAWREAFGSDAFWAARLGRAAIVGGAAGFWPSLTARQFADLG